MNSLLVKSKKRRIIFFIVFRKIDYEAKYGNVMEYMALEIALQACDYDQDHIQHVNRRRMQATGMDLNDIWSQHTNLDKPVRYITSQVLHLLMDNR